MLNFKNIEITQPQTIVTIGVTSYNYSKYIIESLNSLLPQTYPSIELIIIDDCSSDDCPQKIETWIEQNNINCTYIHHNENRGITRTLNEIVSLATGKYIVFFATDDIMMPERVSKQVAELEACSEDFGLCYTRTKYMDEDGEFINFTFNGRNEDIYEGDVLLPFIKRDFGFVSPSAMINMNVYKKIGLYNENILIEDYDFYLRLVACYKVKHCTYPGMIYRIKKKGGTVFTDSQKNNFERYYYDRIISNAEALKFIDSNKAVELLLKKINQYLKTLAINNSNMFWGSLFYLLFKKKIFISPKIMAIKIINSFKPKPNSN